MAKPDPIKVKATVFLESEDITPQAILSFEVDAPAKLGSGPGRSIRLTVDRPGLYLELADGLEYAARELRKRVVR